MTTSATPTPVRIHASNVLQLSKLTDLLNATAAFTNVTIAARIIRRGDLSEVTASTEVPVNPHASGCYAITLSKTVAPFANGEVYVAQFSGTMKDADNNDVDYYEELELVGAPH